ncbi:venom carboxylesterase-6-like [Phymastichus coffea]|uniref:venom carboxylesterase-6-like n=1 Tax=Phymastichus coffea TaxID=108790 RepID=UPI00273A75FB|nr:venom carboxylesterase-6-like [Phymastichus coffea]
MKFQYPQTLCRKMFQLTFSILLNFYVGVISTNGNTPFIQTQLGGVTGTYRHSLNGRQYEAYEGIPYAVPPVQQRRFEPPIPIKKWAGNITATSPAAACIQYEHLPHNWVQDRVTGEEDCLYLNIYVPVKAKSLPVLFVIHGGAFQFSKAPTETHFLMDRDVIVVSISYRLSMFGFLSTEDSVIPGNMGLKDQNLALRWVYDNIEYFKGDPKKITLIGVSAGAASVHYHYLSPMSKGLFQNGISFSGTAFGPGKHAENSLEKAKKLASILGCHTTKISDMIKCLKSKPARSVVNATSQFMPWLYNPFTPFGPVIETSGDKQFINRSAIDIVNSGDAYDVPWITSFCSEDGLYPAADFINDDQLLNDLNNNWNTIAPHLLDYNFTIPLKDHANVSSKIRNYYFGSKTIGKDTIKELVDVVGDRLYKFNAYKAARLQAAKNKSPVLFMYYNYRAFTSLSDFYSNSTTNYGVSHGDDFYMLFDNGFIDTSKRSEDQVMRNKLLDYVVSVATDGFPGLGLEFEWKKVDPTKEDLDYLCVRGPTNIKMESNNYIEQRKFWSTIDFDENKLCSETCFVC